MKQIKPFRLATIALTVALSATLLTFSSASDAAVGGNDELSEGVEMNLWQPFGPATPGGHLRVALNEFKDGDPGFVGGLEMYFLVPGCSTNMEECSRFYIAYCSEADVPLVQMQNPFSQIDMDGRLQYLTWKHDYEFYLANKFSGAAGVPMAATQALVWAWMSDPQTGSTVFSSVAGGFDDPLNWDGLVASLHTDATPRVGFHSDADLENPYYSGTDAAMLDEVNQAVYDLAVEATAKAGPWTLTQGVADLVVLSGANGPIAGETVEFSMLDGSDRVTAITDSSGFAAWPAGANAAFAEAPGATWRSPGPADGGQNMVLTVGETLTVEKPTAPTTTTTTTTTTTAPPTTVPPTPPPTTAPPTTAPPTTTTTTTTVATAPPTTTAPTTTTTTVVVISADPPTTSPPAIPVPDTPQYTG